MQFHPILIGCKRFLVRSVRGCKRFSVPSYSRVMWRGPLWKSCAIHVQKSFCMWRSPLCPVTRHPLCASRYRVATISRLLQIIGLFCKRALYNNRLYPAKETYHFKEPTDRGHPIKGPVCPVNKSCVCIVSLRQRSPANTGLFCKRPLARQEVGLHTFFELLSLKPHKVCLHSFFAAEDACKHRTLSSYCPPLPFVFVYFAKET